MQFNSNDLASFGQLVAQAHNIVLTCHMSPDGDALGSTLGMAHVLKSMGKDVRVVTPDEAPRTLRVIPGARDMVVAWSSLGQVVERLIARADLVLCMDYNALSRLSRLEQPVRATTVPRVLIDHHKDPEQMAQVTFSFPDMSSTCELTCHLLKALGWWDAVDRTAATCLMAGIITDTGGFHYNSNDPELYMVVADLMRLGVDKDWLMRCLLDTHSAASMRLESFAIAEKMELFADAHAALIALDRDELNRFEYKKGDTEGLVNKPLAIPGVIYSCYMRQEKDYVKVSMRSLGDFPVDRLCRQYFGGGGHLNAAGGEYHGTLQQAISTFIDALPDNNKLISPLSLKCANR